MGIYFSNLFFTLLVIGAVAGSVMVVVTQNIVRAACWLLLTLASAAGLFFMLGADFIGAAQLLVYVGGTMVLVIFGVMLTATGPFVNLASRSGDWALALIIGFVLFGLLAYGLFEAPYWDDESLFPPVDQTALAEPTTNRIGMAFLGFAEEGKPVPGAKVVQGVRPPAPKSPGYLLPFEIVSVHLVVVLIGAAYLARTKKRREPKEAV